LSRLSERFYPDVPDVDDVLVVDDVLLVDDVLVVLVVDVVLFVAPVLFVALVLVVDAVLVVEPVLLVSSVLVVEAVLVVEPVLFVSSVLVVEAVLVVEPVLVVDAVLPVEPVDTVPPTLLRPAAPRRAAPSSGATTGAKFVIGAPPDGRLRHAIASALAGSEQSIPPLWACAGENCAEPSTKASVAEATREFLSVIATSFYPCCTSTVPGAAKAKTAKKHCFRQRFAQFCLICSD